MDAETIYNELKTWLQELGLDMSQAVATGFDGASNMAGIRSGVAARIKIDFPHIEYFHCCSHRLNLALGDSSQNAAISRALEHIKKTIDYFRESPKRTEKLTEMIKDLDPESKKLRVKQFCTTRWVERFDSLFYFQVSH